MVAYEKARRVEAMKGTVILDIGGSTASIRNAFERLGVKTSLSHDPDVIAGADRIILPGQGRFDVAVQRLDRHGLRQAICESKAKDTPILGICLGLHLICRSSEEGRGHGFGWIDQKVCRLVNGAPVPNIGWRATYTSDQAGWYYFAHSYAVSPLYTPGIVPGFMYFEHGKSVYLASAKIGSVWGCQFHPEKSQRSGEEYLKCWLKE